MQTRSPLASGNIDIGEAFNGMVGMWVVGVQGIGGGNIAPQQAIIDAESTSVQNPVAETFVACAYKKMSDLSTVAAGTNITVDGIYLVPSHGVRVRLVFTFSAGTPTLWWHPMAGSA
jgi:hypothetical protein